jgi:protein TonB
MLAYAANRPDAAGRRSSPNVMLVIIVAHIAAIAALMSAKMDLPRRIIDHTPLIEVPINRPPPPVRPVQPTKTSPQPHNEQLTQPKNQRPLQPVPQRPIDWAGPASVDPGPAVGTVTYPNPVPLPLPLPIKTGPTLLTPASQLRPPYPATKLLNEEEADLRLRLSIGFDGRVTAVDPIGRADPVFLDAARRYLVAHWRYQPATIDGRAVATTVVITLSFRLDG